MKPKQLIILGIVLVALILLYSISNRTDKIDSKSGLQTGALIVDTEKLNINDVSSLKITDADDSVP